ncbi:hypothetical protein JL811_11470 [Tabrizicola sp. DMG-N-6]|uniref:AsmA-like C-terminal region n=2 Tax=Szabonella alba TaxID=2804194 RepID=A0A8K0VDH9_9RHOB|nr:hypothetical protein [Szabonella alba]
MGDQTQDSTARTEGAAQPDAGADLSVSAAAPASGPTRPPRKARAPRPARSAFWVLPVLIFLSLFVVFAGLALTGRPIPLPVWAVAEAEARVNRSLVAALEPQGVVPPAVSLGGAVLRVDRDWVPRLRLEDLRLLRRGGDAVLVVPEARMIFDGSALLSGRVRLAGLRLIGPRVNLRRLPDGRFDFGLEARASTLPAAGIGSLIDALAAVLADPALGQLRGIEAEAMSLRFDDRLAGRRWDLGDGRLRLDNRADEIAVQASLSLLDGDGARADVTLVAQKSDSAARFTAAVERVAAADLASQLAPLTFLSVLDAPISGRIASALDGMGQISSFEAELSLGPGALRPIDGIEPVAFDSAGLFLGYDPQRERLDLHEFRVESPDLSLAAGGHAYLPGANAGIPAEMLAQIRIDSLRLDAQDVLEEPLLLGEGALDLRLRLDPFRVEIGQIALTVAGNRLVADGRVTAGAAGWEVGLDLGLDRITHDRLLALWPSRLAPRTRDWLVQNLREGEVSNVRAALRLAPGAEPQIRVGYDFTGGALRFLRNLPPVEEGRGYAVIENRSYMQVVQQGHVTAPGGGRIDVSDTVFKVRDVTQRPAIADVDVVARGGLVAALSLLDRPPFEIMTKARLPVDLGEGQAEARIRLTMPLIKGIRIHELELDVDARIAGFRSDRLVPGRVVEAAALNVAATQEGLEITGPGQLDGVPFDVAFRQQFGPEHVGRSTLSGQIELSPETVARLGIALPAGLISGRGQADVTIELRRGEPPALLLVSDLAGLGMALPPLGWSKPAGARGRLEIVAALGQPARVEALRIEAAGLTAAGTVTLAPGGGLQTARFAPLRIGQWLDATVELTGRGQGRTPAIALTGGRLDIRGLTRSRAAGNAAGNTGGSGSTAPPVTLALDELALTDAIRLTAFRSNLSPMAGGLSGDFTAGVNGQAPVFGTLVPVAGRGTAIRVRSVNAGAVFSAARIFPNARGGEMDLVLQPRGPAGDYDGTLKMTNLAIRNLPALAEMLSAISVVGLLEQMNGTGLLFSEAEAEFSLTPDAIRITSGSAVGASLGLSLDGIYYTQGGRLDLQGVISPVYMLNAIGSIFTRRGEGLFGFSYRVGGTAAQPAVSVNPLSILTPGMFREIFRRPPPPQAQPSPPPGAAPSASPEGSTP